MPRVARTVVPNVPHHVVHRGNNQKVIFHCDDDRTYYRETLSSRCQQSDVEICSYCLMSNHVHSVLIPQDEKGLAEAVGQTAHRYAVFYNRKYGRSGHHWQCRFYSNPMDDSHFVAAMRYVEQNPVRAGIVEQAWEYPWSSAAAHCGFPVSQSIVDVEKWARLFSPESWKRILQVPVDTEFRTALQDASRGGHALGSDQFIDQLEARTGRRLRPKRPGRPFQSNDK